MAPDKIYISPNVENRTWLIGKADTTNIEYIRKDALLEWLKMKTETAEIVVANIVVANSVDRWVTRQVYKQVMNKLEAM